MRNIRSFSSIKANFFSYLLTTVLVMGFPTFSQAGVTFYTNEVAFNAATSVTLSDFEGIVADDSTTASINGFVIDGVTYTAAGEFPQSVVITGKDRIIDGATRTSAILVANGSSDFTINFATAQSGLTAAGGLFGDVDGQNKTATLWLYGPSGLLDMQIVNVGGFRVGDTPTFFGWTTNGGDSIDRIVFALDEDLWESIDDIRFGSVAAADTVAVDGFDSLQVGNITNGMEGWSFTPTQNISVTSLGFMDYDPNGLAASHQVGIWNDDGTVLLASAIVQAGTSSPEQGLTGQPYVFRFEAITPVTLSAGSNYIIGAHYNNDDLFFFNSSNISSSSAIASLSGLRSDAGSGFVAPSLPTISPRFGPNFTFTLLPDTDSDGDGVPDDDDLCPDTGASSVDASGCSDAQVDFDDDGYCDINAPSDGPSGCIPTDNCPTVPNPDQIDDNDDGFGDACISPDVQVPGSTNIGDNVIIEDGVSIDKDSSIGDDTTIAENVSISKNSSIGEETDIGIDSSLQKETEVGDGVTIGEGVTIYKGVTIGKNVLIHDNVTIKKDTTIGDEVIVGAGAFIDSNVIINAGVIIAPDAIIPKGTIISP